MLSLLFGAWSEREKRYIAGVQIKRRGKEKDCLLQEEWLQICGGMDPREPECGKSLIVLVT